MDEKRCENIGDSYRVDDRVYTLVAKDPDRYTVRRINPDETFGAWLAKWRIAHKIDGRAMSQAKLGQIIGYSQRQISRFERGEIEPEDESRIREVLECWQGEDL